MIYAWNIGSHIMLVSLLRENIADRNLFQITCSRLFADIAPKINNALFDNEWASESLEFCIVFNGISLYVKSNLWLTVLYVKTLGGTTVYFAVIDRQVDVCSFVYMVVIKASRQQEDIRFGAHLLYRIKFHKLILESFGFWCPSISLRVTIWKFFCQKVIHRPLPPKQHKKLQQNSYYSMIGLLQSIFCLNVKDRCSLNRFYVLTIL